MNAIRSFVFAALALAVQGSFAETKTWNSVLAEGETAALASVASNWLPVGVPTAEDDFAGRGKFANCATSTGSSGSIGRTTTDSGCRSANRVSGPWKSRC